MTVIARTASQKTAIEDTKPARSSIDQRRSRLNVNRAALADAASTLRGARTIDAQWAHSGSPKQPPPGYGTVASTTANAIRVANARPSRLTGARQPCSRLGTFAG